MWVGGTEAECLTWLSCDVSERDVVDVGITPAITNEVGLFIEDNSYDIDTLPRNTRVNAHRVKAIKHRRNRSNNANIAVPNDRACSVRPGDRDIEYESVFS